MCVKHAQGRGQIAGSMTQLKKRVATAVRPTSLFLELHDDANNLPPNLPAYVSMRQHASAYVRIRQHMFETRGANYLPNLRLPLTLRIAVSRLHVLACFVVLDLQILLLLLFESNVIVLLLYRNHTKAFTIWNKIIPKYILCKHIYVYGLHDMRE